MATAKATPAEETPAEQQEPARTHIDKDELKEALRDVLPEFLQGEKNKPAVSTPQEEEPVGPRQEEAHWRSKVEKAIDELLASAKPEKEKEPEKAPPEQEPKSAMRRVEKLMGWQ